MNFTFIPSPEKAKKFTAVEDACKPIITLKIGKWGQAPFSDQFPRKTDGKMKALL